MNENRRNIPETIVKGNKRKKISLETKLNIIDRFDKGDSLSQICTDFTLSRSTVRGIISNKNTLKDHGRSISTNAAKCSNRARDILVETTESLLEIWIKDQRDKRAPLTGKIIQNKALSLHEAVKKDKNLVGTFNASNGWFENFKKRCGLKNVCLAGEAASADTEAASNYLITFREIISKGGYSPKQVYNVDETGLIWKRLPTHTYYITADEEKPSGFKSMKDRVTLLLGGNANGDVKLKPLMIFKSANPRALKGIKKDNLPVIWRSNKKAWMTQELFNEWFTAHFVPFVENYNKEQNLDNKALLILDNAPGHSAALTKMHSHIEVIFLPPNTTSILQPMDQGAIATFKAYYLRSLMKSMIEFTSKSDGNAQDFWKTYSIKSAVESTNDAWNEMKSSTMKGVWKKLWPDINIGAPCTDEIACTQEIVELSKRAGFTDLTLRDISEHIECHNEELDSEELLHIHYISALDNSDMSVSEGDLEKNTSPRREKLEDMMAKAAALKESLASLEENERVRNSYCMTIDAVTSSYKEELDEFSN